jgi:hypothetical protein
MTESELTAEIEKLKNAKRNGEYSSKAEKQELHELLQLRRRELRELRDAQ